MCDPAITLLRICGAGSAGGVRSCANVQGPGCALGAQVRKVVQHPRAPVRRVQALVAVRRAVRLPLPAPHPVQGP
eukprot:9674524-Alexandrium_andersonii.AAC.1